MKILFKDNVNEIKLAMDLVLFNIIVVCLFAAIINITGLYILLKLRNPSINESHYAL